MKNHHGGMLSNIFVIPVGVVLMVGFFFLGYYVGKHQSTSRVSGETAPPLPEIASSTPQKQDEFTFYKTLTDKSDKTVSIDLKPRPAVKEETRPEKQQAAAESQKAVSVPITQHEKQREINAGKETRSPGKQKQTALKPPQPPSQKETSPASPNAKTRYTVQTASYPERQLAEDEVKRLKKRGYAAFIISSELGGKGMWHRVRLGSFSNRAAAEKLQKTIHEKEKISTIVVEE